MIVNIVQATIGLEKVSLGAVMKNQDMLRFIPNYFQTKKMRKRAIKKITVFSILVRCVSDRYKIQEMFDEGILENSGTLKSVPEC